MKVGRSGELLLEGEDALAEMPRQKWVGGTEGLVDVMRNVVRVAGEGGAGGCCVAGASRLPDFVHLRGSGLEALPCDRA